MAAITQLAFDSVYGVKEATLCNHALYRIGSEVMKDSVEDTKVSRVCKAVYAQTRDELLRNYPFAFATKRTYITEDDAPVDPLGEFLYAYRTYDVDTSFVGTTAVSATLSAVTAGLADEMVGRSISGTNIPTGTRIVAVNDTAHTITLDRPCTDVAVGTTLTIRIPLLKIVSIATGGESLYETVNSGDRSRILCNVVSMVDPVSSDNLLEIQYVEQVIDPDLFDPLFRDALVLRVASKVAMQLTSSPNVAQGLQAEFAAIMNLAKQASSEESVTEVPEDKWTTQSKG